MKKTDLQELKKQLCYKKESVFEARTKKDERATEKYARGYMRFLDAAKTEREAVKEGIAMLVSNGFTEYKLGDKIEKGGKYYFNNRDKSLFAFTAGTESIEKGIRICAAHIDSPRLDLKPSPLYEDNGMAYFKTHSVQRHRDT